jgi:hypothetical protein
MLNKIVNIIINFLLSFAKFCYLKNIFFEICNIFANNLITIKVTKVLWYFLIMAHKSNVVCFKAIVQQAFRDASNKVQKEITNQG